MMKHLSVVLLFDVLFVVVHFADATKCPKDTAKWCENLETSEACHVKKIFCLRRKS
jgi:hypothetical protein